MTNDKGSGRKGDEQQKSISVKGAHPRLVTDRGFCLCLGIGITGGWEGKGKAGKVSSAGSGCSPGLLSPGPTTPVLTKGQGGNKIRLWGDYFVFSDL